MSERRDDNPLRGIDAPRPLPPELRARLEAELSSVATMVLPEGVDRPRPLPAAARERVEKAVLAQGSAQAGRPASAAAPAPTAWYRSSRARQLMPLVAAALVLLLGMSAALTLTGNNPSMLGDSALREFDQQTAPTDESSDFLAGEGPPPPFSDRPIEAPVGAPSPSGEAAPSSDARGADAASGQPSAAPDAARAPVRVGLSGPDNQVATGFRSYMNALNAQGGVGGSRRVETVNPSTRGSMATVNTSLGGPLDPRSSGPRLEGPAVPEAVLRSDTFSFASAPERLSHLLADALYPEAKPGASVVIYTGSGVFDEVVPDAVASALREKGIVASRVTTRSGRPSQWPQAEVAVLSMTSEEVSTWLAAASAEGYRPARGVAGLWNLVEPALAAELPEGSTVLTSYATPRKDEADAMTAAAGGPPSFGFVHGWATAKALALALWQSGAETPQELTRALASFPPDDLGGLIAPYRVRPGTNSRTPEGLVLEVRGGSFVPQGGFRADPRT